MVQPQRENEILQCLQTDHAVSIRELAKKMFVSEATIRRDLDRMEEKRLVRRVFGGAMLEEYINDNLPQPLRQKENLQFKQQVASKAAVHLFNGATVIMDGSTTVRMLLPYMDNFTNLTVITNNLEIINEIDPSRIKTYCTGGKYYKVNRVFYGSAAEDSLRHFHADLLFFSAKGFSTDGEISDPSERESALRRVMLTRADKRIFLCDHTKLNHKFTFHICNGDEVDDILCDVPLDTRE